MEICIHHHLGLGDHFDMNGLVRYVYERYADKVYVFSKSNYFGMIEFMYRDEPNIVVVKIDKDKSEDKQVAAFLEGTPQVFHVRIGFENYPTGNEIKEDKNCWEYFYEQVGIDLSVRSDYFHVDREDKEEEKLLKELNPTGGPFTFIHDDPERGFVIDPNTLRSGTTEIRNDNSKNIFHYLTILEEAEEVHCMESSFKTLIDLYSLRPTLYFHDFRGHPLGTQTTRKWHTVTYE
tara:strand:+ start:28541 stop:29242 length:702 start_codon:yes stop_codon:yes gene_type:complete